MSWLFSQALVAEYSEGICSDGEPSAQLNVMPTPQPFWRNDKTMEPSRFSRFGLTLKVLGPSRGEGLLRSFLADSRVRTYPLLDPAPEFPERDPAYGNKCTGLLATYDRDGCLWKTVQRSLLGDSESYSETWPRSGMTRNGRAYQRPPAAPITSETASGSWPTPKANDAEKRGDFDVKNPRNGLPAAVRRWPTATATAYKGWSPNHNRADSDDRIDYTVEREAHEAGLTGRLNPTWVEWLMGFPAEWTELKPLVMHKFREWQRQHSPCSSSDSTKGVT